MYLFKKNIQVMLDSENDVAELKLELDQLLSKYSIFGKYSKYNMLNNEVIIPENHELEHSGATYKPGQIIQFYPSFSGLTSVINSVTHKSQSIKDGSKIIIIGIDTTEKRVLALVLSDYDINRLINGNTSDEFLNHCFENYLLDIKYDNCGIKSINNFRKIINKDKVVQNFINYGEGIDHQLLINIHEKLLKHSKISIN